MNNKTATACVETKVSAPNCPQISFISAIQARFRGPGFYYNLGNLILLTSGVAIHFVIFGKNDFDLFQIVQQSLFDSPGTSTLTLGITIFVIGGEIYCHAWKTAKPQRHLVRIGDLVCAIAATVLMVAFTMLGNFILAIIGGVMLVVPRFGLFFVPYNVGNGMFHRLFRLFIAGSRIPSMAALAVGVFQNLQTMASADLISAGVLFGCLFIWLKGDIVMIKGM